MNSKFSKLEDDDYSLPPQSKHKSHSRSNQNDDDSLALEKEGESQAIHQRHGHHRSQQSSAHGLAMDIENSKTSSDDWSVESSSALRYSLARRSYITGAMFVFTVCTVPLIIVIIVLSSMVVELKDKSSSSSSLSTSNPWSVFQASQNRLEGAVTSDTAPCSSIGRSILEKGGNAVDASIAVTFCLGVLSPASSGIGGGCYILVHNATTKDNTFIDAREVAPHLASEMMFVHRESSSQDGALSVAVLGEVKGLETAYQKYGSGRVAWSDLVLPSAQLAERWFLSPSMAQMIHYIEPQLLSGDFPALSKLFLKPDVDGKTMVFKEEGDVVEQPVLAETLRHIAKEGAAYLHRTMAASLASELEALGGIMTAEDIENYQPTISKVIETEVAGYRFVSVGGSSSGGLAVAGILKFMASLPVPLPSLGSTYYHYLAEAMKHVFSIRLSLGDPDYVNTTNAQQALLSDEFMGSLANLSFSRKKALPLDLYGGKLNPQYQQSVSVIEDHGTSHVAVVDDEGNAVSLTSTVNTYFGSKVISPSTGILFNNQMDDFSTPNTSNYFGLAPSPFNFPAPGKKPLSSMSPSFLFDQQGRLRMIGGASGGPRIITATAQMILNHIWFGMDLLEAVRRPRLHAQYLPDQVQIERRGVFVKGLYINSSSEAYDLLIDKGHHNVSYFDGSFGVSQFISIDYADADSDGTGSSGHKVVKIQAVADPRKNGRPSMTQQV
eukprot:gene3280-3597_t